MHGDAALLQIVSNLAEELVVGRFTSQIVIVEQHVQAAVGVVESRLADVDQALPDLAGLFVAALQLNDAGAGAIGELFAFVQGGISSLIELLGAGQVECV